jgi:hypothetical protein
VEIIWNMPDLSYYDMPALPQHVYVFLKINIAFEFSVIVL